MAVMLLPALDFTAADSGTPFGEVPNLDEKSP
jgi:hypothetical protein